MEFTHFNAAGYARMVDVGGKPDTERIAVAQAVVRMQPATLAAINSGEVKKGDVLGVAQVAGVTGAKQTSSLIPMCHPLLLNSVNIEFAINEQDSSILITCQAKTNGKTGVEMEAITGATVAAMTIYDMSKAIDRWMEITDVKLIEKAGGKSGRVVRETGKPDGKGSIDV
jgi:cyclic pyranopterin phosphate synthase